MIFPKRTDQKTIRIFERSPRWLPELQRQLAGEAFDIRLSHSAADVFQDVTSTSNDEIALFDFNSSPANCLQTFSKILRQNGTQSIIVIHSAEQLSLEWSLRELGITHFLSDKTTGKEIADVCRWVCNK